MKHKYIVPILLITMGIQTALGQDFDIVVDGAESGTKTHYARNSITFANNYTYTPGGGTLTAEIKNPVVAGDISYNYTIVDPMSRSLNTSYLVGSTNGAFNVNALGGATYTIPLEVPEGIGGFAPSLALSYSSNAGNGIAGYGWNIGGLSAITRSPKTYYHDGVSVGVDLTSTDRFSLDGQRLICVVGSYGGNNSKYRTELDNFAEITCLTDGTATPKRFLVRTKSGETIEYGYEGDSDQTIDGLTEEVSWYIDKRTDLYGNIMEYEYIKQNGHNYIGEIKYGPNTVTFYYKERADKETAYFVGGTLQQNLILDKVEMKYNSILVKKYELKYNYYNTSPYYTNNSILNEVIEYGIGNSRYNSTVFSYEYPTGDCNNYPYMEYNSYISTDYVQYPGDFNGDGRTDIFTVKKSNLKDWRLYLATSYGGFTYSASGTHPWTIDGAVVSDLNADGMDDLILIEHNGNYLYYSWKLSTGTSFGTSYFFAYHYANSSAFTSFYDYYINFRKYLKEYTADFDGDGFNDFLIIDKDNKNWRMFSFTPESNNVSFLMNNRTGTVSSWGDAFQIADFNGDGKADIWTFDSNGIKIYSYNGTSLATIHSGSYPNKNHLFRLGDFNGDGKTDIFVYGSGSSEWSEWQFRLSTGTGFVANYFSRKKTDLKSDVVYTGDFNGDGRTDILALSKNTSNNPRQYYFITKPNATNVSSEYYERSEYVKDRSFTFGDYDGNGKTDIVVTTSPNQFYRGKITGNTNILLSRVADGLNNTTVITYRKLSGEYSNYTKGTANDNFPVYTYQGPLTVVSEWHQNYGNSIDLDYKYQGLKIHRQGKGALGYEQVIVEDTYQGTKTETNSGYDGTYFFPKVLSTKNYAGGEKTSETSSTWDKQVTLSVTGLDPIFPYINYHLNRDVLKGQQDSTTFTYDPTIKGSLKESKQKFDNGVTKTVTNTYYANDETNWYIGRLNESTVKYEKSGETAISSKTTFTYSTDGKLKPDFVRYNVGTTWEYYNNHDYNSHGNLIQEYKYSTNGGARQTNYEYETNGIRLKKVIDPVRLKTDYTYDTYGRLQKEIDNRDNETTFAYDNMHRMVTKLQPDGFQTTTSRSWESDSYLNGEVYTVSTTGNDGSQSKTWFDREGKELRSDVKGFGGSWIYHVTTYDTRNRLDKKYEPGFSASPGGDYTLHEYDTKNRLKKMTYPSGKITDITYLGNRVTESTEGITSWKETDSQGLLTKANDFGGTITYNYYPNGQVKKIIHPDGSETGMVYDAAGNQTQLDDPSAGVNGYSYNAYGQIKTRTNARGDLTTYNYEPDGRLDNHVTGAETTEYTYDPTFKHLTNVSSPSSVSRTYSYAISGVKGRLTGITENIAGEIFSTTFEYDGIGRTYKRTHPSGVIEENVYDGNSGLIEKVKAGTTVVWDIDAMNEYGQITSAKYGTNLTAAMAYNKGLPQSATIGSLYQYSYIFDQKFGWPNSRTNNKHSLTENFGYENLRLDSIWGNIYSRGGLDYDANGNIRRKSDIGTMVYDHPTKPYAVTELSTTTNLVPLDSQIVHYTSFEQVKDIKEGNCLADFIYNSDQQRCRMVMKQNGVEQYTRWYAGSKDMKEKVGPVYTQYAWLGGDAYSAPAVSVKVGTDTPIIYYLLRDHLGSITHVVKASDLSTNEYSYDAWGRRRNAINWSYDLSGQPALFAGRGFTGHEHLQEFGLINMNGRLYDPLLGRFLSPDENVQMPDYSQNLNRYSYCLNNPLKYTDPDGEFIFTALAAIFAPPLAPAAAQLDMAWMQGGFSSMANGGNFWSGAGKGFVTGLMNVGLSFVNVPGIIPNGLLHAGGNVLANGITNSLYDQNFFDGAGFQAATGFAGGAYSGYSIVQEQNRILAGLGIDARVNRWTGRIPRSNIFAMEYSGSLVASSAANDYTTGPVNIMEGDHPVADVIARIKYLNASNGIRDLHEVVTPQWGVGAGPGDMYTERLGVLNGKHNYRILQRNVNELMLKADPYFYRINQKNGLRFGNSPFSRKLGFQIIGYTGVPLLDIEMGSMLGYNALKNYYNSISTINPFDISRFINR